MQRVRGVLCNNNDAVFIGGGNDRSAPSDALTGIVGTVLHDLLGRYIERSTHDVRSRRSNRGVAAGEFIDQALATFAYFVVINLFVPFIGNGGHDRK